MKRHRGSAALATHAGCRMYCKTGMTALLQDGHDGVACEPSVIWVARIRIMLLEVVIVCKAEASIAGRNNR